VPPLSVWREHVTRLLCGREAVQLSVVCKAMQVLVRELSVQLGDLMLTPANLPAALTCFPAAESLRIDSRWLLAPAEESMLVELLRGHGATLKRLETEGEGARQLLSSAVRAGALPNLTYFNFFLDLAIHRVFLSGGVLRLLEDVDVTIKRFEEEQLAALEHLQRLPYLRSVVT
jgi:hypothetical protein